MTENFDFIKTHTAGQVMSVKTICSLEEATVEEVLGKMMDEHLSGFPVVNSEKQVVGMVTRLDILREIIKGENLAIIQVGKIMTRKVISADINALLISVVKHFILDGINCIPVTENQILVGTLTRQDIISHLVKHQSNIFEI